MALEPIRPKDLPPSVTVYATDRIPSDDGVNVGGALPVQIVDAGAPVPSEAVAIAGIDNVSRMTPFLTRSVLNDETAPSVLLAQAWAESPTAPGVPGTKSSKTWAAEAAGSASNAASSAVEAALYGGFRQPNIAGAKAVTVGMIPVGANLWIEDIDAVWQRAPDATPIVNGYPLQFAGGPKWFVLARGGKYYLKHFGAACDDTHDRAAPALVNPTATNDTVSLLAAAALINAIGGTLVVEGLSKYSSDVTFRHGVTVEGVDRLSGFVGYSAKIAHNDSTVGGGYALFNRIAFKRVGTVGPAFDLYASVGVTSYSQRSTYNDVRILYSTGDGVKNGASWGQLWINPYLQSCAARGMATYEGNLVTGVNNMTIIGGEAQGCDIGLLLDRCKQVNVIGFCPEGNRVGIGIGKSVEAATLLIYGEANTDGHIIGIDTGGTVGQATSVTLAAGSYLLRGSGGTDVAINMQGVRQFIIEDGVSIRGYGSAVSPIITVSDVGDSERGRGYCGLIRVDAPVLQTLANNCYLFGRKVRRNFNTATPFPGVSDTVLKLPYNPHAETRRPGKIARVNITLDVVSGGAGNAVLIFRGRDAAGSIVAGQINTTSSVAVGVNNISVTSGVDWSDAVSYFEVARSGTSGSDTAGDATVLGIELVTYENETQNV